MKIAEAARIVGVTTTTLRSWEKRYGLDIATRNSTGTYRVYDRKSVMALRAAVGDGLRGESAVTRTREILASGENSELLARVGTLEEHVAAVTRAVRGLAAEVRALRAVR